MRGLSVKDYQMSQVVIKKEIHWPSLFFFSIAISNFISGIYQSMPSNFLLAIGFCCMGYSSIRFLPSKFFTQKLSFAKKPEKNCRKVDLIIQLFGFVFVVIGLVVQYIYV